MKRTPAIMYQARQLFEHERPHDLAHIEFNRLAPDVQDNYIARVYDALRMGAVARERSLPTPRQEPTDNECHRAHWWRQRIMHLTADELAELTGYTRQTIYLMEKGINAEGQLVSPFVWKRYKMLCAAVHAQLRGWEAGSVFDWQEIKHVELQS